MERNRDRQTDRDEKVGEIETERETGRDRQKVAEQVREMKGGPLLALSCRH